MDSIGEARTRAHLDGNKRKCQAGDCRTLCLLPGSTLITVVMIPGLAAEQLYELSQLAGVTMPREVLDLVCWAGSVRSPSDRRLTVGPSLGAAGAAADPAERVARSHPGTAPRHQVRAPLVSPVAY